MKQNKTTKPNKKTPRKEYAEFRNLNRTSVYGVLNNPAQSALLAAVVNY